MKKLSCTFYRPEKVNINEFREIITKLEDDLKTRMQCFSRSRRKEI